jgi:2-keto-4-pentenoate hydratase/2-oxohepta-3-ene-1,7-dioic acid hydratase in catechol pathway
MRTAAGAIIPGLRTNRISPYEMEALRLGVGAREAYDHASVLQAVAQRAETDRALTPRTISIKGGVMAKWVRVAHQGKECFGTLEGDTIKVHSGSMFAGAKPTSETISFSAAKPLTPTVPGKMVALVDNYHALVAKLNHAVPPEPLYFFKGNNSFLAHGETIRVPKSYGGKVVYEGELGIVIGRRASGVSEADAPKFIFGYTCINDVTAIEILNKDPDFAQWTRSKSFDTFGVFGPAIVTDIDPGKLTVKTILNDQERQNYPLSDIIFPPAKLVSLISQDMTLEPGDVIACGTSVGVGSMKPGSTVSIVIDGVGTLTNKFE